MESDNLAATYAFNDLLRSTNKLCSLPFYRKHIPCTPVQMVNDSSICYSQDLKLLLCTTCSKVQSRDTTIRHLKQRHRTEYSRLKKALKSIQDEISCLPINAAEAISISHNKYYFSCLPITFDNFKCRECAYVDINRKNVRNHFQSHHSPRTKSTKSTNQRADYVLEDIPLQVLEGFPNNKKICFIPRLPISQTDTPSTQPDVATPLPSNRYFFADDVRTAILDTHQRSIEERQCNQSYNDAASNNKKLLNSFLTNSNVLDFLQEKDRDILIDLISNPTTTELKVEKDLDLELLEANILTFMLEAHQHIPHLTRRLRQLLKTEDTSKSYKEMKDFIQLTRPEPHFKRYCRLATFIIRVHLIKENYKEAASDTIKSKYFETTEQINLSEETRTLIKRLMDLGVKPIRDDTDQEYTPALRSIVARLFHSLLKDRIHLKVKENATFRNPVIFFYFCSILHPQTKEVLESPLVSKIASIFIYDTRLMFLAYYYAVEDKHVLEEHEMNRMYEKEVRKYLSNDSKNYFEELTQIRAFSLKLAKQHKSTTYTIKESPAGTVEFNGVPYPIEHIKNFFMRLGVQLEGHLKSKLLFINQVDTLGIDFSRIEDTPLLNKTGQSIVDTPQLERFKSWFLQELVKEDSEYNRFFVKDVQGGRIRFKQSSVQRFLADLNAFTELLANAINLYSGGPLRGTELSLILYKNTSIKDRSMLYNKDAGMFFVTTDYNKTNNITRRERVSYRYLTPVLSRIVIIYVAAVLPLRDYIYRQHYRDEQYDNPYLLGRNQGAVSSYSISIRLQKETATSFRKGLSLQAWRKIINFIIKTKMHASPLDPDDSSDSSDDEDLVEDKQANRTTQVSFNHYFNSEFFVNSTVTPKDLSALREFSIRYFNYFNLLDDLQPTDQKHSRITMSTDPGPVEMVTLDNRGVLQRLRRLYGDPNTNFLNNEQRNCVSQVLSGRPYITYINRTGSGKSLVYLLPAFIKRNHLYVIITPRLALKDDLYGKACELKLRPSRFEDAVTHDSNLMFCSVEDLDSQGLKQIIGRHKTLGREVTIMLDEAHLFLIEATFRVQLRNLITVLQYKADVVFITATLPRPLLQLLNTTFGIANFNSIIRGSSNRSDISYRRVYYRAKGDRDEVVRETIRDIERGDDDVRNKVLIFVTNKKQGEDLAELLGTDTVYSGKEDLQRIMREFIESKTQRSLVTTSVLEVGIDIKQIKYTISVEPIYSLTSVVQSSGRIRQRGVSYIVCQQPSKNSRNRIQRDANARREVRDIDDFKELDRWWYGLLTVEEGCLRTPISQFLDHVPYRCQGHRDDLCSLCVENERVKEEGRKREEGVMMERRSRWLDLEQKLLQLKEMYCMYCVLDPYNTSNSINHAGTECRAMQGDKKMKLVRGQVEGELRQQRLPPHECGCIQCLIPKNICLKQQENNGLGEGECLMGRFLVETIAVLFRFQERTEGAIAGLPKRTEDLGEFVKGLMAARGWFTLKTVRLVEVLGGLDIVGMIEAIETKEEGEEGEEGQVEERAWAGRGRKRRASTVE